MASLNSQSTAKPIPIENTGPLMEASIQIQPLDDQFGAYPVLNVPEPLKPHLFVEGIQTFALLDAALINDLPELLAATEHQFKSLYLDQSTPEIAETAPYLVKLDENSVLLRSLMTKGSKHWHLWNSGGFLFFHSALNFDAIYIHFRQLLRIQGSENETHFFRFWDRRVLSAILQATNSEYRDPLKIFGQPEQIVIKTFLIPDVETNSVKILKIQTQPKAGKFKLTPAFITAMKRYAQQNFVRDLSEHCAAAFPTTFERLLPAEINQMLNESVNTAKQLNLTKRGPVTVFTEMELVLGTNFHNNPLNYWATEILQKTTNANQTAAAHALHVRFSEYLK